MKNLSNIVIAIALTSAISVATPLRPISAAAANQAESMSMKAIATTSTFKGVEVNAGNATLYKTDGVYHLKVSEDFKIPASPAPHWQVVDDKGNIYLLSRFTVKGDKTHRDISLPKYIKSVTKVQVWCAFAEVLLGEASFEKSEPLH